LLEPTLLLILGHFPQSVFLRRTDCLVLQTVDRSFQFRGILALLDRVIEFLLLYLLAVDLEQSKVFLVRSLSVRELT
jgi:hypothetical protein